MKLLINHCLNNKHDNDRKKNRVRIKTTEKSKQLDISYTTDPLIHAINLYKYSTILCERIVYKNEQFVFNTNKNMRIWHVLFGTHGYFA